MALVNGNPFGDVRGKLGANVFTRNRHGAVIRAYVKPSQPNSIAQIQQRTRLGNMSAQFRNLTTEQRARWESWARNKYVPRHKINTGNYTAHSAFVGVNSFIQQMNQSFSGLSVLKDATPVSPANIVQTSLSSPQFEIPDFQIANIYEDLNAPAPGNSSLRFEILNIYDDFSCSFKILPTDLEEIHFYSTQAKWLNSDYFNFFVMCSDGTVMETSRPKNFEMFTVASTANLDLELGSSPQDSLTFNFAPNPNISNYSNAPTAGEYVDVTLYAFAENGTYIRLTRQRLEVLSSP